MTCSSETKSLLIGGRSGIGKAVLELLTMRPGNVEKADCSTGLDVSDETSVDACFAQLSPVDHVVFTAGSQAPGGAVADLGFHAEKATFDTKCWTRLPLTKLLRTNFSRAVLSHYLQFFSSGHGTRRQRQNSNECGHRSQNKVSR